MITKISLEQALINILAESFIPKSDACGVCFEIHTVCSVESYMQFLVLVNDWANKHNVDSAYPIENGYSGYTKAKRDRAMWDNPKRYEFVKDILEGLIGHPYNP